MAQQVVAGEADVVERLIETRSRSAVRLLVGAVAFVEPNYRGLVAARGRKRGRSWSSERLLDETQGLLRDPKVGFRTPGISVGWGRRTR